MSQKWNRAKAWDREHLTGALTPVRWVLHAFSSIRLAVVTLTLIAIYGTLASVPLGLLLQIPTMSVVAATFVASIVLVAALPSWLLLRRLRAAEVDQSWRFLAGFALFMTLGVAAGFGWATFVWPALRYDPITGDGFRLFGALSTEYASTTVRRLPGIEMAELEFYGWWPMRVLLFTFVANMIVATVRRIEFRFVNIGVLSVHTGIVTIALGSVYYARLKQEGDAVLFAQDTFVSNFYDRLQVALWVKRRGDVDGLWQQRPLAGVPRYNDYAIDAAWPEWIEEFELPDEGRTLSIDVPLEDDSTAPEARIDGDLRFEVVGYASYADGVLDTWSLIPGGSDAPGAFEARTVEMLFDFPDDDADGRVPVEAMDLLPAIPADRVTTAFEGRFALEYVREMSDQRWADLTSPVPPGTRDALIVEVTSTGERIVEPVVPGRTVRVGGYNITVTQLLPQPPFPIVTPGFENASSGVVTVRVEPPRGTPFDRWIFSRFPSLNQDFTQTAGSAQPERGPADPAIRIAYLETSTLQVHIDERATGTRAVARKPLGELVIDESLEAGGTFEIAPQLAIRLDEQRDRAVKVKTPNITPEAERRSDAIGTHQKSALAVKITSTDADWSQVEWLPFAQFLDVGMDGETDVTLPDERVIRMAFGRRQHGFPGFSLKLEEFEMIPYPHSDVPRDFRSDLIVWDRTRAVLTPEDADRAFTKASTSMNRPLLHRVRFQAREDLPAATNFVSWLLTRVAPTQYKISQSGWDRQGWTESKARVDAGELDRPRANWTILGIGNNPGIYIIAFGSILACVGVPWAFYIKPLLVRRQRDKLKRALGSQA